MRNDYPDHPAGPIEDPDPAQVLEIGPPRMNAWIFLICGVLMLMLGLLAAGTAGKVAQVRAAEDGEPVPPPPPFGLIGGVMGLVGIAVGVSMLKTRTVVLRLRPDGVEFPAEGLPPLRWDQIESVDIATLVLIGAGGPQDYLGIKLRPEVLPEGPSPYSTGLMQLARKAAGWDFDVCLSQNHLGLNPAHLSMEMRARLEAAQRAGANPAPPPGASPLGGIREPASPGQAPGLEKPQTVPRSGLRMGCAALMVLCGGCAALPGVLIATGQAPGKPPPRADGKPGLGEEEFRRAMQTSMAVGLVLVVVGGIFVWPWPDDDDEG